MTLSMIKAYRVALSPCVEACHRGKKKVKRGKANFFLSPGWRASAPKQGFLELTAYTCLLLFDMHTLGM